MRVSEIEALSASDLDERALSKRFPSASVRRTSLEVVAEGRP
jgi:hypothetical protein